MPASAAPRTSLLRVAQRLLQRLVDLGEVEAREHVDQVRLDERVLAIQTRQQVGDHFLRRDLVDELEDGGFFARLQEVDLRQQLPDVEPILVRLEHLDDRGFRVLVLAEQVHEPIDVEALVAREGPGGPGHRARVAVCEPASDQRQCLVAREAAQQLDVLDRLALVGGGQRFEDLRDRARAELPSLANSFFPLAEEGSASSRICAMSLIGPVGVKKVHRPRGRRAVSHQRRK